MSDAPKKPKRSPGRPKKPDAERLEQFSIRLPSKLKFGLELLARAQHRSLSQAVEWALQVGLNSFSVDNNGTTMSDVLESLDGDLSDPRNTFRIYMRAPVLLSFEDAMTCEAVFHYHDVGVLDHELGRTMEHDAADKLVDDLYWKPVFAHWDEIKEQVIAVTSKGGKPAHVGIRDIIGVQNRGPLLAAYQKAATARSKAGA